MKNVSLSTFVSLTSTSAVDNHDVVSMDDEDDGNVLSTRMSSAAVDEDAVVVDEHDIIADKSPAIVVDCGDNVMTSYASSASALSLKHERECGAKLPEVCPGCDTTMTI